MVSEPLIVMAFRPPASTVDLEMEEPRMGKIFPSFTLLVLSLLLPRLLGLRLLL